MDKKEQAITRDQLKNKSIDSTVGVTLIDGTPLSSITTSEGYFKISEAVEKDKCNATMAYLCYKYGCLSEYKCQTRVSKLDGSSILLCSYERAKFFEITAMVHQSKVPLDLAEKMVLYKVDSDG